MRRHQLFSPCLSVLWALTLSGSAVAADAFIAQVDRERLAVDETLTLRLIAEGKVAGEPDLAPLDQDFEVLNQGTSSRVSIVNGAMSQSREWTLELAPRRPGPLEIPALALDGARSQPIRVEVVPADQPRPGAGAGPRSVFVQTEADTTDPYVQQAFTYLVKVLYREQPRRAVLSDPQAEGATLERQGDDQSYSEMIEGQRYTVIERRFLVIPQRSGPLTIRGPRLEVLMPEDRPGTRRGPFADFEDVFGGGFFQGLPNLADPGSGRRVVERGPDLTVGVRPQPAGSADPWLAAESVQLSEEWTPAPPRFRVGEPITRTLVITARGATAAQLPTLDPGSPDGAKVYPEQPRVEDLPGSGAPASLKTLKVALVPGRVGSLTLPEIRLSWWDTVADQARVAVIPQRTLVVEPAPGSAAPPVSEVMGEPAVTIGPAASPAAQPAAGEAVGKGAEGLPDGTPAATSRLRGIGSLWPRLALFFGLGWLLTLGWLVLSRRARADRAHTPAPVPRRQWVSARSALAVAAKACAGDDPRAARAALLDWGRARWPDRPPGTLGELADRLGAPEAGPLLGGIDRALYAPAGAVWNGAQVWQGLAPILSAAGREPTTGVSSPLPGLYPPVTG